MEKLPPLSMSSHKGEEQSDHLNICLLAEKFPVGGRAFNQGFLWPIARGLAQSGHKVTVISWSSPLNLSKVEEDGVIVYFVAAGTRQSISKFPLRAQQKFEELHLKAPFDIVHSLSSAAYRIGHDKKRYAVAVAYDVQATRMARLFALIGISGDTAIDRLRTGFKVAFVFLRSYFLRDLKILKTADGVFVNSPQQQMTLERYYLYPEKKTYQVPYGIDIGDLSLRQPSQKMRQKLKILKSTKVAVTISDMVEKQEIFNILYAFQKVVIKKPSSVLIIVGEGPNFKAIEKEMLSLALGNHVILAGHVAHFEIPDFIDLANVFIEISSRNSGFETSLFEAMIQEKVVVGSEVSPISTIIEDAEDGFLIRPADVSALSQLLLDLFLNDTTSVQVGKRAREKILNIFDTKKMIFEMVEAYKSIIVSTKKFGRKSRDHQTSPLQVPAP